MGFGPSDDFLAYLKQMRAERKIIPPGELVRRVKAGPGPESLSDAQRASEVQASTQQGIETDTRNAVRRLEGAWSGPSGDAAREALRPLAEAAISALTALDDGQNILTDQVHAFTSTRNSLHDVSDDSPSKTLVDAITPWNTDNEDKINERNAAIQQNHAVYQGFTDISVGHAQKMPVDYGQLPGATDNTVTTQEPGQVAAKQNHPQHTVARTSAPRQSADRPSSPGRPEITPELPRQRNGEPYPGGQQSVHVPAALRSEDGTHAAGYTPPEVGVNSPPGSGPATYNTPYVLSGGPAAGSGSHHSPGDYPPRRSSGGIDDTGTGSGPSPRNGPSAPGKATGTGRPGGAGGAGGPRGGTGPGATGARGTNGVPITTGKGDKKEKDEEHKTPEYLQEADPNALFGYDGKATPPVIGK